MGIQYWRNLALDPKVVTPDLGIDPTASKYWSWGAVDDGGSFGDVAGIVTTGGPLSETPHYAVANTGASLIQRASLFYGGNFAKAIPVTEGQVISFQMWGHSSLDATARMILNWWTPAGTLMTQFSSGEYSPLPASTWQPRTVTVTVPSGVARMSPGINIVPDVPAMGTFRASALTAVPAVDGNLYAGPYFDGSSADVPDVAYYSWDGAVDESSSLAVFHFPEPQAQAHQASAQVVPIPNPVIPRVLKPLYLKDFSVQEDSTPIYASDMTGGAGTMTLQVDENQDTPYLLDAEIDLVDPAQGTTRGTIRGLSSDNTHATLVADSRVALLNVTRQALAVDGTFRDAVEYYLGLCGITDGYVIETSIAAMPVVFLGFDGNVLEEIKKFCPALGVEMSLVSNNIVFRPARGRVSENYRDSSRSWSYDTSQKAQQVDIYQYTVSTVTNALIYNGFNAEQTPMSVEAGATAEFTIPIDGSIISLDQPVYTANIGPGDPGFSAYNAVGNDNLPITPSQWENQGGRLSVAPSADSRSIIVTVTAPLEAEYSPYRIGISDGETAYSTLRIHGSAILYTKNLKSFHTAVDPDRVSQVVGATIDSPYIQSDQQVLDVAMGELRYWGGNRRTINVETRGINRLSDNGSYAYAEFSDFDAWWDDASPGATFADFDTDAPAVFGNTFGEHDTWWIEEVQDDFANQAFGNIAGARVYTDYNVHRIRTATTSPQGITYTAWEDSIFSDHDALWDAALPGATFADFDAHWYWRAFVEFDATPLEAVDG